MYTWGYVTHRPAFVTWAEEVEATTRLVNSAAHLRWNSDKTYLGGPGHPRYPGGANDLGATGRAVVPTR